MPDAMCLPDFLVLLFSLVADFAVPREEAARPENELADERSAFSPHQSCRDLLRVFCVFATSQGAEGFSFDFFPPLVEENFDQAAYDLSISAYFTTEVPIPAVFENEFLDATLPRWRVLQNLIRPAVQLTVSMGSVFATPQALAAALIRAFLAAMTIERAAKLKRVTDAATAAAVAEAHAAALASARAEAPRGPAAADADLTSGGYARSAAEGHSVPSAIITAIMESYLWELMKHAAASQQHADLHSLMSPPDDTRVDDFAAFEALAGHIYMAISFVSAGITGKSSSAEERTFYKIISSLQGAIPRGLFSVLEAACRPLAGAGRRVFFPGAIVWFRKSFLILELGGGKTTSIIDNLHHFSPHSEEFDTANKLEDMKDANKLDCVCTFLNALSYCFPLFAGTLSAGIFRRDVEAILEVSTKATCFPGGVFAIFRTIYRRVILSWAEEARSVMLTAPETAASFKKLDARLTLESLSSDFLSAAAVKMLMDAISTVRQAKAFGFHGAHTATAEECLEKLFPDCHSAWCKKTSAAMLKRVELLEARVSPANSRQPAQSSPKRKPLPAPVNNRAPARSVSPKAKKPKAAASGGGRASPKPARQPTFMGMCKSWLDLLKDGNFCCECIFIRATVSGTCVPKGNQPCFMCTAVAKHMVAPGGPKPQVPDDVVKAFFAKPEILATASHVGNGNGKLLDQLRPTLR